MKRKSCAGCAGNRLEVFLDLGSTPLADYFPSSLGEELKWYPLQVAVCPECWMVQLMDIVPDAELFGAEYSFFSGTSPSLVGHLQRFAAWTQERFPAQSSRHVTEIACNDGTLLINYSERTPRLGVDPSGPPVKRALEHGIPVINTGFNAKVAADIGPTNGLVIANNVLAHVADLNDFVEGISILLGTDGVFVGEFQYLPDLLAGNSFDLFYHEHRTYLSLTSLEPIFWRNGLTITEAHPVDTQGGSMRIVARPGNLMGNMVTDQLVREARTMQNQSTYVAMEPRVEYVWRKLLNTLERFHGKTVAGYAATAKSCTLLNFCGIGRTYLKYVVDTTPHKIGKFTPGTNVRIISPRKEYNEYGKPDAYLMLAGNYLGDVLRREMRKSGTLPKFIVPLPVPVVI